MTTIKVKFAEERLDELEAAAEEAIVGRFYVPSVSAPEVSVLVGAYRERDVLAAKVERLREALRGIAERCESWDEPVTDAWAARLGERAREALDSSGHSRPTEKT